MKKHFMTGLAILLPIVLTWIIVMFIVNFLTKPFTGIVRDILERYDLLGKPIWIFSSTEVLLITSKLLILVFIIFVTILIGLVARFFIIRYFFRLGDYLIHRIPLVNKVYKAIQETLHTLFASEKHTFKQVVLVPFPHPRVYSIGLITGVSHEYSDKEHQDLISVFIPGTPNPTVGFMILFRKDQMIFTDMSVEEAFKFIVSLGVMISEFRVHSSSIINRDVSAK